MPQKAISHPPMAGPVNLARLKLIAPSVMTDATEARSTSRGASDIRTGEWAETINPEKADNINITNSSRIPKTKKT